MDINNQSNQELLSAYLDDALSGAELAQVESWLATDDSAVSYLNELRSNRQSLKARPLCQTQVSGDLSPIVYSLRLLRSIKQVTAAFACRNRSSNRAHSHGVFGQL